MENRNAANVKITKERYANHLLTQKGDCDENHYRRYC